MASSAACAQYSSLVAAPWRRRRRPASPSSSRVHIPLVARTAPRSLSVSLSVLRPCAHRGASDESAAGDACFSFSPCDPAIEDPYDVAATTTDLDADDGFVLQLVPFVEDPFESVATTGGLDEGKHHDQGDTNLVLRLPTVDEPHEVTALVLHVGKDPHELTATTDLCVVVRHDTGGLVLYVPTEDEEEETHEVDGARDDCFVYPSRLTIKDLDEYEATDFSPAAIEERFRVESKEAKAAVKGAVKSAVAGVLRPLRQLVDDLRSLGSVFDAEEFQIGMPFGAIMTCMGMYQMWKLSPSTCIDVAMYYAFYKLSVIAADVRRRGFSPDWIIRIKLGIIIAVLAKELGNQGGVPLDFIRLGIFSIYAFSVMWDVKGLKKYTSKCFLHVLFHELITGERLAAEETTESHVTKETAESHVAEEMGEGHVTEKMVESHDTEEAYEIHIAEKMGESHIITEETVESHVTQKTGESQATYEMGESHVTRESHVTEEAGECHVTEETGEVHITEETGGSHVTDETGEGHVTEEACESQVREETGESLVTEETSEGHVVTEKMGVKAT